MSDAEFLAFMYQTMTQAQWIAYATRLRQVIDHGYGGATTRVLDHHVHQFDAMESDKPPVEKNPGRDIYVGHNPKKEQPWTHP